MSHRFAPLLDALIAIIGGVFIGYAIFQVIDFRSYPGMYAMQSAPWYLGILLYGAAAAVAIAVLLAIKWFLSRKSN